MENAGNTRRHLVMLLDSIGATHQVRNFFAKHPERFNINAARKMQHMVNLYSKRILEQSEGKYKKRKVIK